MDYLEYVGVVHRDLAARNVLGKSALITLITVRTKLTRTANWGTARIAFSQMSIHRVTVTLFLHTISMPAVLRHDVG